MDSTELQDKFFDEISNIKYNLIHIAMKVEDLVRLHDKGPLSFDTEHQLTEVWNLNKKRLLIDSILR